MKGNTQEKCQRQRKWFKVVRMLFEYRDYAPFSSHEFYDDHFLDWDEMGIKTWESLDTILRRRISQYRYCFKDKSNPCKPYLYLINAEGIHLLRKRGYINPDNEEFYQEEVREIAEEFKGGD